MENIEGEPNTLCAALAFSAIETRASGLVAVYGLVGWVVMEPDEGKPRRVQIHGVFSVIEGYGSQYTSAQKGYLYYEIDQSPNGIQTARGIVEDLRKIARTGEVVSFGGGGWNSAGGKVRKATD